MVVLSVTNCSYPTWSNYSCERWSAGGLRTYNADSGYSVGIPEITSLVNELLDVSKPLLSRGEERPSEVMDVIADISRAKADLGWQPRVSLREGLRLTILGMMKQPL